MHVFSTHKTSSIRVDLSHGQGGVRRPHFAHGKGTLILADGGSIRATFEEGYIVGEAIHTTPRGKQERVAAIHQGTYLLFTQANGQAKLALNRRWTRQSQQTIKWLDKNFVQQWGDISKSRYRFHPEMKTLDIEPDSAPYSTLWDELGFTFFRLNQLSLLASSHAVQKHLLVELLDCNLFSHLPKCAEKAIALMPKLLNLLNWKYTLLYDKRRHQAAGAIFARIEKEWIKLESVYVKREYRGLGLGSHLLNMTLHTFTQTGQTKVFKLQPSINASKWYRSFGFAPDQQHRGWLTLDFNHEEQKKTFEKKSKEIPLSLFNLAMSEGKHALVITLLPELEVEDAKANFPFKRQYRPNQEVIETFSCDQLKKVTRLFSGKAHADIFAALIRKQPSDLALVLNCWPKNESIVLPGIESVFRRQNAVVDTIVEALKKRQLSTFFNRMLTVVSFTRETKRSFVNAARRIRAIAENLSHIQRSISMLSLRIPNRIDSSYVEFSAADPNPQFIVSGNAQFDLSQSEISASINRNLTLLKETQLELKKLKIPEKIFLKSRVSTISLTSTLLDLHRRLSRFLPVVEADIGTSFLYCDERRVERIMKKTSPKTFVELRPFSHSERPAKRRPITRGAPV